MTGNSGIHWQVMGMRNIVGEVYGYRGPIHSMYACGLMLKWIYVLMYCTVLSGTHVVGEVQCVSCSVDAAVTVRVK